MTTKVYSTEEHTEDLLNIYNDFFKNKSITKHTDELIEGTILSMSDSCIILDVNSKDDIIIDLKKEKLDSSNYQVGDKLTVKLKKTKNGQNSYFSGSIKDGISDMKVLDLKESIGKEFAYLAKVEELIHGGYYLKIDGIKVFMPGSLAGMNKLYNFEDLLGKTIEVMTINFSEEKNTVIVSRREYLKRLIPIKIDYIKENISTKIKGTVTGTSKNGVFVEFHDCLTGLIVPDDMDKFTLDKFNSREFKPGESIEFYIKSIINPTKIMLSINKIDKLTFKENQQINGTILKIMDYGLLIDIGDKNVGLMHHTECKNFKKYKEGDQLNVKILKIDNKERKIYLTL
jgi:ribosomal protein S1